MNVVNPTLIDVAVDLIKLLERTRVIECDKPIAGGNVEFLLQGMDRNTIQFLIKFAEPIIEICTCEQIGEIKFFL